MASREAFGGFTFAAFSAKNIPVVASTYSCCFSSCFLFDFLLLAKITQAPIARIATIPTP